MKPYYKRLLSFVLFSALPLCKMTAQTGVSFPMSDEGVFIENKGQFDGPGMSSKIEFMYVCQGFKAAFTKKGVSYEWTQYSAGPGQVSEASGMTVQPDPSQNIAVSKEGVEVRFGGERGKMSFAPQEKSDGFYNYYLQNVPGGITRVRGYKKLVIRNAWHNADLVYYAGRNGRLKYDIVLHPGGQLSDLEFRYTRNKVNFTADGIKIKTGKGIITESIPRSYCEGSGDNVAIRYVVKNNSIGFAGAYNSNKTLVIDPVIVWDTVFQAGQNLMAIRITTSNSGLIYVVGHTNAISGLATPGAFQTKYGGSNFDGFISCLSPTGRMKWSTYYGGSDFDGCREAICDDSENLYVVGTCGKFSTGLATTGSFQSSYGGGDFDAFLVKFDSAGARKWATYYGGTGIESGDRITSDAAGDIYIGGNTNNSTSGIATSGAHQVSNGGSTDGYIAKFHPDGHREWGTYYGGTDFDYVRGLTSDGSLIYVVGVTYSTSGIATSGAQQTSLNGTSDAYIMCMDLSGTRKWGTYFGGAGSYDESANDITCNVLGDLFITGNTTSPTLATTGAYQTSLGGIYDAFLARFSSFGKLSWCTYFGADKYEYGEDVVSDEYGNAYITGLGGSKTNIASPGAPYPSLKGNTDGYVAKFSRAGARIWSTYLGIPLYGQGYGICYAGAGQVYICAGYADNSNGPTKTLLAKYGPASDILLPSMVNVPAAICLGDSFLPGVVITNYGTASDSIFPVQVKLTGPEDITIQDTTSYVLSPGESDTLWFSKPVVPSLKGNYKITFSLDRQDEDPGDNILSAPIIVNQVEALFDSMLTGCEGDELLFTNLSSSTNSVSGQTWDFGDSTSSTDTDPFKKYAKPGQYKVSLTVHSKSGCSDVYTHLIEVHPRAKVSFYTADSCEGARTHFINTSTLASGQIKSYRWRFGDGGTSTVKNPVYIYSDTGTYTVTLIATTEAGCIDSVSQKIVVYERPKADFSATDGCQATGITFTNQSIPGAGNSIKEYKWFFGDGGSSATDNPVHRYSLPGKYLVKLVCITDKGCRDSLSKTLTVYPAPAADFDFANVCIGNPVIFKNNSSIASGNIARHLWSFGDGDTSTAISPQHTYSGTGMYDVTLVVVSAQGCIDTVKKAVRVYALPSAGFTYKVTVLSAKFTVADSSYASYDWNFGDGGTSVKPNPVHSYASPGKYAVSLKVTDSNGCTSVFSDSALIEKLGFANFTPEVLEWKVFPNPFEGRFAIDYTVLKPANIDISLIDATGKQISIETGKNNTPGKHLIWVNSSDYKLAPGIYLIQIRVDGIPASRQIFHLGY